MLPRRVRQRRAEGYAGSPFENPPSNLAHAAATGDLGEAGVGDGVAHGDPQQQRAPVFASAGVNSRVELVGPTTPAPEDALKRPQEEHEGVGLDALQLGLARRVARQQLLLVVAVQCGVARVHSDVAVAARVVRAEDELEVPKHVI